MSLIQKLTLWTCTLGASVASAGVVVVDPTGNGDFLNVQAAVTAAAEGDTILVKSGGYAGFQVVGKSLTITADLGANVTINTSNTAISVIRELAPGQRVEMRGIHFKWGIFHGDPLYFGLAIAFNQGSVWLEDCSATVYKWPAPALLIQGSADVKLSRCEFEEGAKPGPPLSCCPSKTETAIEIKNSRVVLEECVVIGAGGVNGFCDGYISSSGVGGAPGIRVNGNSNVFVVASSIFGGKGGCQDSDPSVPCFVAGGDQGPGLEINGGAKVWAAASTIVGGDNPCAGKPPAPPATSGGTYTVLPILIARTMHVDSPLRTNQTAMLSFAGDVGDKLAVLYSLNPGNTFTPALGHSLLLGSPVHAAVLGTAVNGQLNVPVALTPLPGGMPTLTVMIQAAVQSATGATVLGNATTLTMLDPAF